MNFIFIVLNKAIIIEEFTLCNSQIKSNKPSPIIMCMVCDIVHVYVCDGNETRRDIV